MAKKVADRLTPITVQKFLSVLGHAWVNTLGTTPKKESLLVLAAQSALETGRWKYNHNYNFGNVKGVPDGDGRDYSYYACNEIFDIGVAAAYQAKSTPDHPAKIAAQREDGKAEIWFYPEHPACCFRAYSVEDDQGVVDDEASVLAGMADYLGLLFNRFQSAWPAVVNGDPAEFVRRLKASGYFTADLEPYLRSVKSLFNEFSKVDFDFDTLPIMSDAARAKALALIQITYQESFNSLRIEEANKDT